MKRRIFLKGSLATTTLMVAASAGMLIPKSVLASAWPKAAFEAKTEADALNAFFGTSDVTQSDQVSIKAPLQAENGAVVPIKVMTSLENVEGIAQIAIPSTFSSDVITLIGTTAPFSA